MIGVTCAGGKTGKAIISHLAGHGKKVRAIVRHPKSLENIRDFGAVELVACDLSDREGLDRAFHGLEQLYYIAPNMDPEEYSFGLNVLASCIEVGIKKIVFHSMLHTQIQALPHHFERSRVEEEIINSGLKFVILQCGSYMQNMLPSWSKMLETGIHSMPYDADTSMSLVDLKDVCEVAEETLHSNEYDFGMFEIAGTPITMIEKASILSEILGQEIKPKKTDLEEILAHARSMGFSEYALNSLKQMFPYYDRHGLIASSKSLENILGRKPTDFRTFVKNISDIQ